MSYHTVVMIYPFEVLKSRFSGIMFTPGLRVIRSLVCVTTFLTVCATISFAQQRPDGGYGPGRPPSGASGSENRGAPPTSDKLLKAAEAMTQRAIECERLAAESKVPAKAECLRQIAQSSRTIAEISRSMADMAANNRIDEMRKRKDELYALVQKNEQMWRDAQSSYQGNTTPKPSSQRDDAAPTKTSAPAKTPTPVVDDTFLNELKDSIKKDAGK
ncbi:MAG: hypothetical protein SGI71_05075 [Verrucomicrobiota bacterium]|nr:hypothetical protein [Verrucomicrobiota bacterium]